MAVWHKLLEKAKASPKSFHFSDLVKLAELAGFECKRQKGSHMWMQNSKIKDIKNGISLQEGANGHAKPYQVREILKLIEDYDLSPK